jgi:F-type H+-transporting ATPase subunit gamma
LDLSENAFAEQREGKKVYIVGVTSNRGLCGGFNNNIVKKVNALIADKYAGKDVKVIAVGKKINDSFKRSEVNFRPDGIGGAEEMFNDLTFERSSDLAQFLMDEFAAGKVDEIVVVYNKFKNAAVQIVMAEQFLPIEVTPTM